MLISPRHRAEPGTVPDRSSSDESDDDTSARLTGSAEYASTCQQLKLVPCGRWMRALVGAVDDCAIPHYGLGPRGAIAVGASLNSNAYLLEINLSQNRLAADGANVIASALLANRTLRSVDLSKNGISADGCEVLARAITSNRTLVALSLAGNGLGDLGVKVLLARVYDGEPFCVQNLSLADNGITAEGAREIVRALHEEAGGRSELRTLDVRWNALGASGAIVLAQGMLAPLSAPVPTLTELDLAWNRVSDDGAVAIAAALPKASALAALSLDHNGVGVAGATALARALRTLGPPVGGDGGSRLAFLSLSGNSIGRQGLAALVDAVEGAQAACPLRELTAEDAGTVADDPLYLRLHDAVSRLHEQEETPGAPEPATPEATARKPPPAGLAIRQQRPSAHSDHADDDAPPQALVTRPMSTAWNPSGKADSLTPSKTPSRNSSLRSSRSASSSRTSSRRPSDAAGPAESSKPGTAAAGSRRPSSGAPPERPAAAAASGGNGWQRR
jgi:Ran GTPase-activating protein (RanGAP) involved in mRNA processing and transport